MSKSRWTPAKEILLVQKYEEFNGDLDSIISFFPDKNKRTIMRRYTKLETLAKEKGFSVKEFVQSRENSTISDEIR